MDDAETLNSILQALNDAVPKQIEGRVIASTDGFLIASTLDEKDAERVAAMVATTVGVSRRMTRILNAGSLNETAIVGVDRHIRLYLVDDRGVLAVITKAESNTALINLSAREAVHEIADLMNKANP